MEDKHCTFNVAQSVAINLGGDYPTSASIDGNVINNLCGLKIETEGDDMDYSIITFKIRVRSDQLTFVTEQKQSIKGV